MPEEDDASEPDDDSEQAAGNVGQAQDLQDPAEGQAPKREKKPKKLVRRRKSKKEKERPITAAIRLAVESGKVGFGARTAIADSKAGSAKLFVIAGNAPPDIRDKIMAFTPKSGLNAIEFEGSSIDLGSICGKPFPVSVLSVYDAGSSNILELIRKKQ